MHKNIQRHVTCVTEIHWKKYLTFEGFPTVGFIATLVVSALHVGDGVFNCCENLSSEQPVLLKVGNQTLLKSIGA